VANKDPSLFAIITARGGSRALPRKNLRLLAGKPLIAHTILAARGCSAVQRCFVSTEDREIAQVSGEWGAEVIHRPPELATDEALSRDVVRHALETLRSWDRLPRYFALLQPTSPLRTSDHIAACFAEFVASGARCAISVTEVEHHPYKAFWLEEGLLEPIFDESWLNVSRQTLPRAVRQNGAIYILASQTFLEENRFFVRPALPFLLDAESSIDIDTEADLRRAEEVFSARVGRQAGLGSRRDTSSP
jgi:CMP-N-acetylneuraminic acid synthetase